jgi:ribosomal protein S18 acetylase RimI-like enzyme
MCKEHVDNLLFIENTSEENLWSKGDFESHIGLRNHSGLVAMDCQRPVGFIVYERRPVDSYLQIWNLVVDSKYRRMGVGTFLVKRLTEMVPEEYEGVDVFVRESNTAAHLFLKSLGFWCDTISRDYFIDRVLQHETRENAYGFDFNKSIRRSKHEKVRVTDRVGAVVPKLRLGSGRDARHHDHWQRHRQGEAR